MRTDFKGSILLWVLAVLLAGCGRATSTRQPDTSVGSEAYWPTEGWQTSPPEAEGMDSEVLAAMLEKIRGQDYDIDSVTVIRHGYLVVDAVIYPYAPNSKHIIHSCTKSVVSALIGIAMDKGYIQSIEQPVLDFFPNRAIENMDANKEKMTLEHLLTMTSGLRCRDSYLYRWSGLNDMRASEDWIQYMLDLPMSEEPGTRFEYCNGASFLLSAILSETTGVSALEFASEHLFGPLGISDVLWPANPQGINLGWGELRMLPHDMAKIGYLYLRGGRWNGERILPSSWVEASTKVHATATLEDGYGYQWWVDDSGMYMALGYAGQFIFVVPDKDMVVVFTSDLGERDFYVPQRLLTDFIVPAAVSSGPLASNPEGASLLQARVGDLANP